ncbi:uncharacterized protein LOC126787358 [Argentina anserina]|uniref:uncharacterized protein LOC126787358 n=1 Tax=Argentina anserina TaxID=57926 RepID=UPI0021765F51|nr:uncharacterized protein LOC126787358 [Potentilla anserina]
MSKVITVIDDVIYRLAKGSMDVKLMPTSDGRDARAALLREVRGHRRHAAGAGGGDRVDQKEQGVPERRPGDADGGGVSSLNMQLRRDLDLHASLVNCFNLRGLQTKHENVDIVVIRENTEGDHKVLF